MKFKKLATVLLAGCMLWVTACGATTENNQAKDTEASSEVIGAEDAQDTTYPITITHAFGETIITEKPENIVTLGWCNQDVPLGLGVVPVFPRKSMIC